MNDNELDARLRAGVLDDAAVARLPLSPALDHLAEEIMHTPAPITDRRPMRRTRLVLAAAATVAAVLVGAVVVPDGDDGPVVAKEDDGGTVIASTGNGRTTFDPELVAVAVANERILVDQDGWSVSQVDEFTESDGQMIFSDGPRFIALKWAPAVEYAQRLAKHRQEFGQGSTVPVLGGEGRMFSYGGGEYETLLEPTGETYVRFRGNVGDEAAYRALLADMHTVDVQTWLSALPESAVTPRQQAGTIEAMLRGVPLPPGFDRASIDGGEGVRDRYQLGAAVAGAVGCAWVHRWDAAVEDGDTATAQQAVDAMATSRRWKVLLDMDADGEYPEVFWAIADEMAGTSTVYADRGIAFVETVDGTLGCA